MPSERLQRRIDALLDEVELAASALDWSRVRELCDGVLRLDPQNEDARSFLAAVDRDTGVLAPTTPTAFADTPYAIPTPDSFVAGRYSVRRFLGEGGKKKVFLAHDMRLDRDVAFALIKTEGLDEVGRERITREAQAMGRLGAHPHVVAIFEIGEEAGAPYVVTELLGGGDVEGLLASEGGPPPLARTLKIAKDVCRGLAFAHAQGVVHRDLKPGNVWLTSEGRAKLGDFGLAVALDRSRLTTHGLMVGTVAYMPPEQALGGEVTPQADLYSLGAMLYELVTGRPPFQADDPTAVISQHINTPPVAPSWHSEHCPPDLEVLILKMLAKVPTDRPASAQEVLEALERVDPEAPSVRHSDSSANPLDRLARGVFVGRERELDRLRAAFDEAFAGRGSVVMLVGEPGIGKTRTVQELSTYARMRGAKVLWGRAHEASGAPPYWPWTQVARGYRDQTPDEVRRRQYEPYAVDLQRIFPNLRALFPNLPEPPPVDSEEAQFQLFDALSSFFRAVSAETPLVIVLDDLHWADRSTLRMLTHFARELAHARLLVVGTYRDTDLDRTHPLSQALAELNREDLFTRTNLRGISLEETTSYIRATAGSEVRAELVRRVHEETEGNPFFLSEVVRLMAEEGAFSREGAAELRIPEGVKEALGRRLDRLSPEANELLSIAAVVGRDFDHALLAALSGLDDDTLLALIEEALRARVIEETGAPGEYRFTHALMQDALYSELSTARRVRMHGRVAETIEELHVSELEREAAQLARHFSEAAVMTRSLAEKAVEYAELAAQQSEAVAAWDEAAHWYREALTGLEEADGTAEHRGRLWISLSLALKAAARRGEGWVAFRLGVEAYAAVGDARLLAQAVLRGIPLNVIAPEIEPFRDVLDKAIGGLGDESSFEMCSLIALRSAFDESNDGDAYAQRARGMALSLGLHDEYWPWRLETREVNRLWRIGEAHKAAQLGQRLHETLLELVPKIPFAAAVAPLNSARVVLTRNGEIGEAEALSHKVIALAESSRNLGLIEDPRASLARFALWRNERDTFESYLAQYPDSYGINRVATWAAIIRGNLSEAARMLPPRDHPGRPQNEPSLLALELHIRFLEGSRLQAALFDEWKGQRNRGRATSAQTVFEAGDCLLALGDEALIRECYMVLTDSPWYQLAPFSGEAGDVMRGKVALRLGKVDEAERHLVQGIAWARRPDVRFGLVEGRCLQGLADVAEARGERLKAMECLDGAGAKFAEYGAKLYLDQVLAKKQLLRA